MKNQTSIKIIRHGPKERIKKHLTGTEAKIDQDRIKFIQDYGDFLYPKYKDILLYYGNIARNKETALIIKNKIDFFMPSTVTGYCFSSDLLAPGMINGDSFKLLISSDLPKIWGEAEEKFQTVKGVTKEDRGLYSWASLGIDYKTDGISLRETAYRIGKYVLKNINFYNDTDEIVQNDLFLGISNSGFIEFFAYSLIDMVQGKEEHSIKRFYEMNGAIKPLEGVEILYKKHSSTIDVILPNTLQKITAEIDMLKEQNNWLEKYGEFDQIAKQYTK